MLAWPAPLTAVPAIYEVDADHSSIGFTVRHFATPVPGRFRAVAGTIRYDPEQPAASSVELRARAASIATDNDERDAHLRGADFLDADHFPELSFVSTGVTRKDADTLAVTGDLVVHGISRRLTVPVDVLGIVKTPGGEKAGFATEFAIDRRQLGIHWNRVLDTAPVLADEVRVTITIEANRVTAAVPPQPGAPQTPQPPSGGQPGTGVPDLAGTWQSSLGRVYVIAQSGSALTWQATGLAEQGKGTVSGATVSASWEGDLGSGTATGKVEVDAHGRAVRVEWSNGVVFFR